MKKHHLSVLVTCILSLGSVTSRPLSTATFLFKTANSHHRQRPISKTHVSSSRNPTDPNAYLLSILTSPPITNAPSTIPRSGNGLFATSPIRKGQTLFTVPQNRCLAVSDAWEDPLVGEVLVSLSEQAGEAGRLASLVAKIVLEGFRAEEGWGEYLETLPRTDHVLWWDEEELRLIEGSCVEYHVMELKEQQDVISAVLMRDVLTADVLKSFPRRSEAKIQERITAALVAVLSRSFHDEEWESVKMVPVLDMAQHCWKHNVRHETIEGDVVVVAAEDVARGEELFLDYGLEEGFFPVFGFVPGLEGGVRDALRNRDKLFFPHS